MARRLVRLKLRLLANTFRLSTAATIGIVVGALLGAGTALVTGLSLAVLGAEPNWPAFLVTVFAAVWIGWVTLPIITFSSDDTLDPRQFTLLPVGPRQLVPGLFAAGLVGIGPLATLAGSAGAVPGVLLAGGGPAGAVVAVVAVVLLLLASVSTSRAVVTVLSSRLASRRGRDVLALLVLLMTTVVAVGPQLLLSSSVSADPTEAPTLAVFASAARVLAWTPGGAAGGAIVVAADGDVGGAVLRLAAVVAWTVAMLAAWAWSLRSLDRQPAVSGTARHGTADLYPRPLRWLPRTATTVVAMRFLRMLVRDARVRNPALGSFVALVPAVVVVGPMLDGPTAPLYAAVTVLPFGMIASTQVGFDGPALWVHHVTGDDPRRDLVGRDLGLALVAMPMVVVTALVAAWWADAWATVPAGIVLGAASLATMLGVGSVAATRLAAPIPEEPSTAFGSGASGTGLVQGLMALFVLVLQACALAPIAVVMAMADGAGSRLLAATAGVAWGVLVLVVGIWSGTDVARRRGADLLEAIDPRAA